MQPDQGILTQEYVETLRLYVEGHPCKEIALLRNVSERTVKHRLAVLRALLGAANGVHLAALAVALEIVRVEFPPHLISKSNSPDLVRQHE